MASPISGDITGLHWLNPTETPLDALVKGAQTGTMIANAMAQRQALSMKAAELPFQIQALDTENKIGEQRLVTEAWKNEQLKSEQDAWMRDMTAPENQDFWNETNPEKVLTMPQPAARSLKGQTIAQGKLRMASESELAKAYQSRAVEDNQISAALIKNGGNAVWKTDQFGRPMLDREAASAEAARLGIETQADKIEQIRTAGELRNEGIVLRGGTQLEIAQLKASVSQAEGAADKILNQAMKATYLRQLDVIKGDGIMTSDQKQAAILKLARQYNLGTIGFPDKSAAGLPAPAPTPVAPAGPARPTTQAEYNALPSGTVYIHPSTGEAKQKP